MLYLLLFILHLEAFVCLCSFAGSVGGLVGFCLPHPKPYVSIQPLLHSTGFASASEHGNAAF